MNGPTRIAFAALATAGLLSAAVATFLLWMLLADPIGLVEWAGRLAGL